MFVGEFQIERGVGQIAQDPRWQSHPCPRRVRKKSESPDNIAANEDGIERIIHARKNVCVRNQRRNKRKPCTRHAPSIFLTMPQQFDRVTEFAGKFVDVEGALT